MKTDHIHVPNGRTIRETQNAYWCRCKSGLKCGCDFQLVSNKINYGGE